MLNWRLNRLIIKNWKNSVYSGITHFFQGSATVSSYMPVNDGGNSNALKTGYSQEWILHQEVSDIVMRDIEVSIRWIFPNFIREAYRKLSRKIVLYFYLDELDEEFDEELRKNLMKRIDLSSLKPKFLEIKSVMNQSYSISVINIKKWYRIFVARLKRIFRRIELKDLTNPAAYALKTGHSAEISHEKIRGPDRVKLKFAFPFHKRN